MKPKLAPRRLVLTLMLVTMATGAAELMLQLREVSHEIDSKCFLEPVDSDRVTAFRRYLDSRLDTAVGGLLRQRKALRRVLNYDADTPCRAAPLSRSFR